MDKDPVKYATAYNFGPDPEDELEVEHLVNIALEKWGEGTYEKPELQDQPHEAGLLKLDISKAEKDLDWRPKLNSTEAIHLTMDWYRGYLPDPVALTKRQIHSYFDLQ